MSAEENAVILVAGATGILGSHICRLLDDPEHLGQFA